MKSIKKSTIYILIFILSVTIITGNISCNGSGDKHEKQADDTTTKTAGKKDTSAKIETTKTADTSSNSKQLNANKDAKPAVTNNTNTTNQQIAKTTQPAHTPVIVLNSGIFDATIKSGITLVDFWATWCKPCRMEAPIVEEVNDAMAGRVKVCKMDIDQNKDIANSFNIQYIPTLIIFKDGKIVKQFTGFTQKEDIMGALTSQLK